MAALAQVAQGNDLSSELEALIRGLHANDTKAVCYVTGGASQACALDAMSSDARCLAHACR